MKIVTTKAAMLVLVFLLASSGVLSGCAPAPQTWAQQTIRIAALPIIDALPFYVAEEEGLFAKYGVAVTFVPAASAAERDQLIAAGQADGMINDLVSVTLYNKDTIQLQTVRFAMTATADTPMFRVLAAKDSSIQTAADLDGVEIGVSQGTIIDYVTTRLLEREGLTMESIRTLAVPKLNERMALLGSGQLQAATLPEPFGTLAVGEGARIIVDDSKYPEYGSSVISFRKAFIDESSAAVEGFLAAVEEASAAINADPDKWRPLLEEYQLTPKPLVASYKIPKFPAASIPTEAQFQDVVAWATRQGILSSAVAYSDSVTGTYLP